MPTISRVTLPPAAQERIETPSRTLESFPGIGSGAAQSSRNTAAGNARSIPRWVNGAVSR